MVRLADDRKAAIAGERVALSQTRETTMDEDLYATCDASRKAAIAGERVALSQTRETTMDEDLYTTCDATRVDVFFFTPRHGHVSTTSHREIDF